MASEYNSNLISKLYKSTNSEEIITTLEDMADVGDPIFLHPILDGYKKYKDESFGHYFFGPLEKIRSENTGKYLNDLLEKGEIISHHTPWVLNVMNKIGYYTDSANKIAESCLENYLSPEVREMFGLEEWTIENIFEYLREAKIIDKHRDHIRNILFKKNLKRKERAAALSCLLKINASEEIDYLITNYRDRIIKDSELELIVVKEFLTWTGKKVEQLKDLIVKDGQEIAKEIIEKNREEKAQSIIEEEKINQRKESIIYANLNVVQEIINIRKDINRKTELNESFLYRLFPQRESLMDQSKSTNDEKSFIASCSELRSIVKEVSKNVKNHGLSEEEVGKLSLDINISDRGKSLHQLYICLKSKGIDTDSSIFGLKLLNKILSLVVHPELNKKLRILLPQVKALEMYDKKEWSKVHKLLLEFYKESLEKLNNIIS